MDKTPQNNVAPAAGPTVRRAVAFSFLDSYLSIALTLVSFTLLARLLTPQQLGLYSVALAIISLTQVIRDFGLVSFIIQKKDLTEDYVSSAWGMSLILGLSLFVVLQATAPLIGRFYDNDDITTIVQVVTLNLLLLPFNSMCAAMLRRDLQFPLLMRINLSASLASTMTTLLLAWLGFGALSLAIGSVFNNIVIACGVWLSGIGRRLRRPTLLHWREILHFGGPITFSSVITSIAMDINELAVGKILDFRSVALISRAQGLMNLFHRDFMNAVRSVAYPAFARVNRDNGALEEKYRFSVTAITAVAWPFYGFAGIFALEVLRLMFGTQWDDSAPLVPLFCAAGAFSAMSNLIQPLMLAAGHARLVATADLIYQPVKAFVLCLVVYVFRDLGIFAFAFMVTAALQVPLLYTIKQRSVKTEFAALARALLGNVLLAGLTLAPALAFKLTVSGPDHMLPLSYFLTTIALTFVTWILLLWAFQHPLYREAMPTIRARLQRKRRHA